MLLLKYKKKKKKMDWLNLIVFENDNIVCILLVMAINLVKELNILQLSYNI